MARQRLQKVIADAGICSRRAAERLITAGRVRVDGQVVESLGAKADPETQRVEVDGKRVVAEPLAYVVLHKPRAVVATLSDPQGRPTVAALLAGVPARLYPVGRLDFATSGVLLMTNDGELTHRLLHPRTSVAKTYVAKVRGLMTDDDLARWRDGMVLDDGPTLPAKVRLLRHEGDKTWIEITLREGRNQQIRRMGEASGFPVMRLARIAFAGIECGSLRPGDWRALSVDELKQLRKRYGVPRRVRRQTALHALEGGAPQRRGGQARTAATRGGAAPTTHPSPRRSPRVARSARSGTKPRATGRRVARGRGPAGR